jgi:hypothetical protein
MLQEELMMDELVFRDLELLLQKSHIYIERYKQELDGIHKNLWLHLDSVPQLSHLEQQAVLSYFLELACQTQNILNIELGRASLIALPRDWLLKNIERAFKPLLQNNDEWEYRRLLEVCWKLDRGLVDNLILWGLDSTNLEIQQTAKECLAELE